MPTDAPRGPPAATSMPAAWQLSMLNTMPEGSVVDYAALIENRAATKDKFKLKKVVSSPGGLTVKGLTVKVAAMSDVQCTSTRLRVAVPHHAPSFAQAHAFTTSAEAAIKEQGGTCVLLSPTTQEPLE